MTSQIRGWDHRRCGACRRPRVHFRTSPDGWQCIGTAAGTWAKGVTPCGKTRIRRLR